MTLTEALQLYLDAKQSQNLRPKTILDYQFNIGRFIHQQCENGIDRLEDLTPAHIRAHLAFLLTKFGDRTVRYARTIIMQWLRWLQWEDHLPAFDWGKRIPQIRVDWHEPRFLTENECRRLQEAAETYPNTRGLFPPFRNRALLAVLLDTGLRIQECLHLRLEDIDLESGAIHVHKSKGRRERTTFFGQVTAGIIRDYLTVRSMRPDADCPWVWLSRNTTGQNLRYNAFQEWLYDVAKRANLIGVHAHSLRHTYTTLLLKRGVPVALCMQLLGHKHLETTQLYVHLVSDDARNAYQGACPMDNLASDRGPETGAAA